MFVNPAPLPTNTPLADVILLLTLSVPFIFAPVPVTTKTFALPTAEMLILPFADGMLTLLFPLANGPYSACADKLPVKLPVPDTLTPVPVTITTFALPIALIPMLLSVAILILLLPFANVPTKLPDVVLPVTDKLVNVPTLVMLGCAAVVTVPAVVAELATP